MTTNRWFWVAAALLAGCADDSGTVASKGGSTNVTQGGAQDFEQFRTIIEEGGVPSSELLNPVGFMAEHAIDLPPADCGQSICMHPSLAVAPRFDGGNWTMAFVAMNTPIDPSELERPPLHLVVAIESSNAFEMPASSYYGLFDALRPEDRVTLIGYGSAPFVAFRALEPEQASAAVSSTGFSDSGEEVDLYAALAVARQEIAATDGYAGRVLLVTSGLATAGVVEPEHIIGLGETMAREQIALGIVGFGESYDATIPAALGSLGAGTYSFASSPADLAEVLRIEGETALFPLATDFSLRLEPAEGYRIGRIYGVKRARLDGEGVELEMPALFIGQRDGASDVGGSRRGGGGGLFVELIADGDSGVGADAAAYTLSASYLDAEGEQSASLTVQNELAPGQNPEGMWPFFSLPSQDKPYMVLNMYLAFKATINLFEGGDCGRAMGVVDMMAPSVEGWQGKYDDFDIADDYNLLQRLRQNLVERCQSTTARPPTHFDGGCMFL